VTFIGSSTFNKRGREFRRNAAPDRGISWPGDQRGEEGGAGKAGRGKMGELSSYDRKVLHESKQPPVHRQPGEGKKREKVRKDCKFPPPVKQKSMGFAHKMGRREA